MATARGKDINHPYKKSKKGVLQGKDKQEMRVWYYSIKKRFTCVACGESHPACIEFHHKNREEKDFAISEAIVKGYDKGRILKEIMKCIPLCVNCHRKVHFEEEHV